jgi:hypothetical protein
LNLTAIYKAVGSPKNKRPNDFLRYSGAAFVDYIADQLSFGVGISHSETATTHSGTASSLRDLVVRKVRVGREWEAYAHWQVGLAYYDYLSDPLREHMHVVYWENLQQDQARRQAPIPSISVDPSSTSLDVPIDHSIP